LLRRCMGAFMLTPNKKIFYAIEAVLYIAYNAKAQPVAGTAVSAAQGLPVRYLEPLMQKLVRAGILRGQRGPAGGYVLGRERRRITLADICAVMNPSALPAAATTLGKQVLQPAALQLSQAWHEQLSSLTIADLCERASHANIAADTAIPTDFTI
jgi:Rrf2 family transcriptional regulator, iron-sulfur cluster assembly transcription factor